MTTILTVRTTRGREKTAINSMDAKVESGDYDIRAVFYPEDLKGYLFVEGNETDIKEMVRDMRHVRGVIDEEVDMEKIEEFLSEEPKEITLEVGDKVEVTAVRSRARRRRSNVSTTRTGRRPSNCWRPRSRSR
ncbi:MAG: hypothetical protein ABEK12_03580 [Candidatus Nanohaloarchaea archaeon]